MSNRTVFVVGLVLATIPFGDRFLCHQASSQEASSGRDGTTQQVDDQNQADERADAPAKRRPAAMERRRRQQRIVQVKDPALFQQDGQQKIFSGPQPGETLPPLEVIGLSDKREDEKIDVVKEFGDGEMILIFQDDTPGGVRGLLGFSRAIKVFREKSNKELPVVSVFLDDDSSKIAAFSKRFRHLLQDVAIITVSPDGRDGPGAFGLNRNVNMTVLIAKDGKVLHNFVFPQSMLYPDPHVMGAIAAQIGEERDTVAKWFVDAAKTQSPMRRERNGS